MNVKVCNKMTVYKTELESSIENQKQKFVSLKNELDYLVADYHSAFTNMKVICLLTREGYKAGVSKYYIKVSGKIGKKGLCQRYRISGEKGSETIKDINVVRNSLYINGKRYDLKINSRTLRSYWLEMTRVEGVLSNIALEILSVIDRKNIGLKDVVKLFVDFKVTYFDSWTEFSEGMFRFNRVGGKFTKNYKISASANVDKRLKNPFLCIGGLSYNLVWGGDNRIGSRYSRRLKSETQKNSKKRKRISKTFAIGY